MAKALPKRLTSLPPLSSKLAEDERAKHTRKTRESEWSTDPENPKNQCVPPRAPVSETSWDNAPHNPTNTAAVLDAIEQDKASTSDPELIKRIWATGRLLWSKNKEIAKLTEELETAVTEARRLQETVLPDLMSQAQTKELTSDTGVKLEKKDKVYASISKANETAAQQWLEKQGFGALIKFAFSIPIEKGDTKTAKLIRKLMKANKLAYDEKASVHPQTLLAFVRESIEKARQLPESIAYHVQPIVEIKLPKTKKTTDKFKSDSNDIDL